MSTANPLVLYRNETIGAGIRHISSCSEGRDVVATASAVHRQKRSVRASEFLVQLMVGGDADLRKTLGRRDIAERRAAAYGAALTNRPSARPLSFLRSIGSV